MMQQNHIKDSLLSANEVGAKTTVHTNGQSNGNAKIVLVSGEAMEIDNRGRTTHTPAAPAAPAPAPPAANVNDEELTPLTWLHDKNLLKGESRSSIFSLFPRPPTQRARALCMDTGESLLILSMHYRLRTGINISCPPAIKHGAKVMGDTGITIKAQPMSTSKSSSPGALTPTSDFVDDSGVSEDNASSVNSGSEHGGDVYPHNQPPPASSIVHLSPGGSTVIEYKTSTQKSNASAAGASHAIVKTISNGNCSVIASTVNSLSRTIDASELRMDGQPKSASSPHTHFHKRYIKAMNALNGIDTTLVTVSTTSSMAVHSASEARSAAQPATIHAIPMQAPYASAKYEHGTVIVENEHSHARASMAAGHYMQAGDDDRHADEYVTPMGSPRLQSHPAAPQKLSSPNHGALKTPPVIAMTQSGPMATGPAPPLSPNSSHPHAVRIPRGNARFFAPPIPRCPCLQF